jgi:hypothetical protein
MHIRTKSSTTRSMSSRKEARTLANSSSQHSRSSLAEGGGLREGGLREGGLREGGLREGQGGSGRAGGRRQQRIGEGQGSCLKKRWCRARLSRRAPDLEEDEVLGAGVGEDVAAGLPLAAVVVLHHLQQVGRGSSARLLSTRLPGLAAGSRSALQQTRGACMRRGSALAKNIATAGVRAQPGKRAASHAAAGSPGPAHLAQQAEVRLVRDQRQHDQVRVKAVQAVPLVGLVGGLALLPADVLHDLVLALARHVVAWVGGDGGCGRGWAAGRVWSGRWGAGGRAQGGGRGGGGSRAGGRAG